ncbi:MAG: response regulator [Planctomycetota bacterium]
MVARQRIALIEDNEIVRSTLLTLLQTTGFETEGYPTAENFLEESEVDSLACVVLDLRLPGMNGFELLRRLRGQNCMTPVIVTSGSVDQKVYDEVDRIPDSICIAKPFKPFEFVNKVKEVIDRRAAA